MIKLRKGPKPQILVDNSEQWKQEYIDCLNSGIEPSTTIAYRYKHTDIKTALEQETHGKCAYCESKIKHVEFGDIEHILPKKKNARPDLYVEWTNLTLACEICNRRNKKDYYDPQQLLVNPYIDNPEDFFMFLGPFVSDKNNLRGRITKCILDLNRGELIERRSERIKSVELLYNLWYEQNDSSIKKVLAEELRKECLPDKEYSAFVRHFLISKGFPENLLQ